MNKVSLLESMPRVDTPPGICDAGLSEQQMTVSSHANIIVATALGGSRFVRRVGTGSTSLAEIGVTLSLRREASAGFRGAFAIARTTTEEIPAATFPNTVFGAEEGVLDAATRLFVARALVIARNEKRVDLGILYPFQPCSVVVAHGLFEKFASLFALFAHSQHVLFLQMLEGLEGNLLDLDVMLDCLLLCAESCADLVYISLKDQKDSFKDGFLQSCQLQVVRLSLVLDTGVTFAVTFPL